MKRKDYPAGFIRKLLGHYNELSNGKWAFGDSQNRLLEYEDAITAKVDLDRAIASLDYVEREIIIRLYIEGYSLEDLKKRFEGLGISRTERMAIRNMAAYLNGECILKRWCNENDLVWHRDVYIPDYLPEEIQQYIKDICLKYCVLKECAE